MTRRLQSLTRNAVPATVARRQPASARQAARDGEPSADSDIGLVCRAIDRLIDEITDDCIEALDAVLERRDLQFDVGAETMREVVRDFVHERILAALGKRPDDIVSAAPALVARLRVSGARENLVELIAELSRD